MAQVSALVLSMTLNLKEEFKSKDCSYITSFVTCPLKPLPCFFVSTTPFITYPVLYNALTSVMQHQKGKKNYVIDYFSFEAFIFQHNFSDFKKHQSPTSSLFSLPSYDTCGYLSHAKNIWFTTIIWEICIWTLDLTISKASQMSRINCIRGKKKHKTK